MLTSCPAYSDKSTSMACQVPSLTTRLSNSLPLTRTANSQSRPAPCEHTSKRRHIGVLGSSATLRVHFAPPVGPPPYGCETHTSLRPAWLSLPGAKESFFESSVQTLSQSGVSAPLASSRAI